MNNEEFYNITNKAEGIAHVIICPPGYVQDDMEIEFLDGPLKGFRATVSSYNIKDE